MVDEKRTPKISVGIISLVVILSVLCLTVFSVLTLSTALQEKQFSEKSAGFLKTYYAAEQKCACITNEIGALWKEKEDKESVVKLVTKYGGSAEEKGKALYLSYACPIDEEQEIAVTLCLDEGVAVTRWQVVSTGEWTPDESLQVWDGE